MLLTICFVTIQAYNVTAQIITLSEEVNNAEIKAKMVQNNAEAKAKMDAEYLRLHPAEATNALSRHQLELLDITGDLVAKSNYFSKHHIPQELEELTNTVQYFATNAAAQSSYYYHLYGGLTESEYMSNSLRQMHFATWPDSPQKREALKHSAEVLPSAINTNQIEITCGELTNHNDVVALRNLSEMVMSNLSEFSDALNNSNLITPNYLAAQFSNPTNKLFYLFWTENGPVRLFDKRLADGRSIILSASFYESGKLERFALNSLDAKGFFRTKGELIFNKDGTLRSYWIRPVDKKP